MNADWASGGHSPTYSAVILYYRRGPEVLRTIDALRGQTVPPREIVLVDNCSGDGVVERLAASIGPTVRIVTSARNLGYSGGMRFGADQLDGRSDLVLFLTHEVILADDCCDELLRALSMDAGLVQVGPVTRLLDSPDTIWSAGGILTSRGNTAHRTAVPIDRPRAPGATFPTEWLDGCCHMIRADVLTPAVWDERYFVYWEDVDISTVLRRYGHVACAPRAVAWQGTGLMPTYYATRNRLLYWRKWRNMKYLGLAVIEPLAKVLVRDLRPPHPDWVAARARTLGIFDGMTGRLRAHRRQERAG